MIRLIILTLIFSGFSLKSIGQTQDTILFMSGVILPCEILNADETEIQYRYKKRKKFKTKSVHKSAVFGIVQDDEREVYYSMNAVVGDDLTVKEVEIYMAGERDARNNFNTVPVFIGGLSFGVIASIIGRSSFIALAIPVLIYPVSQYIPVIKIKEETITNPNHRYNEIYAEGYEVVARSKKVLTALGSSAIGTAIGVLIYRLVIKG